MIKDWKCSKKEGRRKLEVKERKGSYNITLTRYTDTTKEEFTAEGKIVGERVLELYEASSVKEFTLKQVRDKIKKMIDVTDIVIVARENGQIEDIKKKFKESLIKVWYDKSLDDYHNSYYYVEDALKCRLYFNIVKELGEDFFENNDLRLYSEYHIPKIGFADMALVDISSDDDKDWKVLSIIELKNKTLNEGTEKAIEDDYYKMRRYSKLFEDADLFIVSVNTEVDEELQGSSWAKVFKQDWHGKRLTELILDDTDEETESRVYDWYYKNNSDKVLNYVKLNEGICDDCLSDKAEVKPRQQVNQICSSHKHITREKSACIICNKNKMINSPAEI